jgi:hypothetical protein
MQFGSEILRGVRLAAILIAIGLVGLTVYRILDVEDDDDTTSAASVPAAVTPAPVKPAKQQSKGEKFYPPPPPPLPGRAVASKPAPHGRDIVVVNVPEARESLVADASVPPSDLPSAPTVDTPVVTETPAATPPAPAPAPVHRSNSFIRSVRRFLHIGK